MVSKADQQEAYDNLREVLSPGDTLHTVLRHVSKSGMTRWIDVYKIEDGEMRFLSFWVSDLLDYPMSDKHQGVKVGGCGMDMGFHLVYNVSRALFASGYDCIQDEENGVRCPSNHHVNARNRTKSKDQHTDGYAISHKWI